MSKPSVGLGYPTEAHGRIPAFNSVEEEAAFWDTHDITGFLEESRPVRLTVGEELAHRLVVRLERGDREELARRARARGVDPATLVRIWLEERLWEEADVDAASC